MQNDKGTLWYGVGLDNKDFKRQAQEVRNQFKSMTDSAKKESGEINQTFKALTAGIGVYFGGRELFQFGKDIAMVRGEFQQLEVAFTTMLKSKAKADALMAQVVTFAATTPYELQDVGKGAKQLLAFQVPAEEVTKTLRQIGDLAAGVGAPLTDLVSIYGKVKAKGKLQAEEMNLFLERGIPLVSELADQYDTTEQAIYQMASQGKIGFSDLQSVISKLTSEGGMFFNLMDEQSKTITGQISNLADAWAQMLNDIGESNEGTISDAISGAKYLVEHYEDIWKITKVLIATYGSYKAALISVAAVQKASLLATQVTEYFKMAKALGFATANQIAFNRAVLANPYALIASALIGVTAALFAFRKEAKSTEDIIKDLDKTSTDFAKGTDELDDLVDEYETLKDKTNKTKDETERLKEVIAQLADTVPDATREFDEYGRVLDINIEKVKSFSDAQKEALEISLTAQIEEGQKRIKELDDELERKRDVFQKGETQRVQTFSGSAGITVSNEYTYKYTEEEKQKAANEALEIDKQRLDLLAKIQQAQNTLKGINDTNEGGDDPVLSNINREIKETSDLIKTLEGDLLNLRSGQTESVNYAKDIEDKAKSLSEAQKKLQVLTGQKQKKEKDNTEKHLTNLEKLNKEKALAIEQLELAAEQARIDAMEKGAEKTLAQNELNYKRQVLQIEKQKADMLQKLRDVEKTAWEADGGKGKFQSKITELPAELNKAFTDQTKTALIELERANAKTFDELLKASGTNSNDVSAILQAIAKTQRSKLDNIAQYETLKLKELAKDEQKYDAETYKKKKALINQEAKDATEAVREEAQKALESIPKQMLDDLFSDFDLSFTNLDHATLGQLNNVADKLTKLSLNKNELIKLGLTEEQIIRLESVLKALKEEGLANTETAKLDRVRDIFNEVGAAMSQASDEMTRSIGQMVTSVSNLVTTLNDPNAKGFEKASGIVSFAIAAGNELAKIRTQSMNKEVDAQKRINEGIAEQLTLERELNRIRRERAETERNSSAFLESYYKDDYKAALDTLKESEKMIDDSLMGILDGGVFSAKGSAKRRLFGRKSGTYEFSIKQILGDYMTKHTGNGAQDLIWGQGLDQLFNGGSFKDILGGFLDPAGIFGGYADGKAQKDALKKLRNAFDKTFEKMGKTSADMANMSSQEWVDFFSLMEEMGHITDKSTKEMIENAKAAAEEYAKAMEEMRDIISDVAGNLGSSLQNTLVTAFENGEDAALAFKDTVNDVLKSIFMKNLETAFFQKYFDKLQKDMEASMDGGDGDWSDDIMRFFEDITPALGQAEEAMAAWDKAMEEAGYEGFGAGSRSGASKGFAAMSQDTGDELNGRFTAIQSHTYSINEQMKVVVANNAAMLRHLMGIEQNTGRLEKIEKDMASVKSGINTITTQGIKLKK